MDLMVYEPVDVQVARYVGGWARQIADNGGKEWNEGASMVRYA